MPTKRKSTSIRATRTSLEKSLKRRALAFSQVLGTLPWTASGNKARATLQAEIAMCQAQIKALKTKHAISVNIPRW